MLIATVRKTLIQSKLTMPRLPGDLVPRPILMNKLRAGSKHQLTLICAPAGFGKTTTVTAWLSLQTPERPPQVVAWYTIDAADDHLPTFYAYLVAAIHRVLPSSCRGAASVAGIVYHPQFKAPLQYLLRLERSQAEIAEMQLLAARWYAQEGFVEESMPSYLAAGQPERAADQLELTLSGLINRAELLLIDTLYDLLPANIAAQRRALRLSQYWLAEKGADWMRVHSLVQDATALLRQDKHGTTAPSVVQGGSDAVMTASTIMAFGSLQEQLEVAQRALALLPEERQYGRENALTGVARVHRLLGRQEEAVAILESAL